MLIEDIIRNTAYCGLICPLDTCFKNCRGCKLGAGCSDENCYHKECCLKKSIEGCWECDEAPCSNGYFSMTNPSRGQFTASIKFIKMMGIDKYIEIIKGNMDKGIKYGLGGDYANKTDEEVMDMLREKTI